MAMLRTLPEALAQAARAGGGYCFIADGVDRHRSYAEIRLASFRIARSLRAGGG